MDLKISWMKANPAMRVRIEGTDDDLKSDAASMQLGEKRAQQAKRRLMLGGIDGTRIDVVSYGEERPVCIEKTEACRAKNRRVDFVVVSVGSAYLQGW